MTKHSEVSRTRQDYALIDFPHGLRREMNSSNEPRREPSETEAVDGSAFRASRHARGDSQTKCAAVLTKMGHETISQSFVSRLERGELPPLTVRQQTILKRYIEDDGQAAQSTVSILNRLSNVAVQGFPRAGEIVESAVKRLREGPSMSAHDLEVLELLLALAARSDISDES